MNKHLNIVSVLILTNLSVLHTFGQNKDASQKTEPYFSITKATKTAYDSCLNALIKTAHPLTYDSVLHKKINGVLSFNIKNKLPIKFTDTLNAPNDIALESRNYEFIGQFKSINRYVVKGNFWESVGYYLIDTVTGIISDFDNLPVISNDGKYLATIPSSYGLMGNNRGFTIFKLDTSSNNKNVVDIKEYLFYDEETWEPHDIVWNINGDLLIQVTDRISSNNTNNYYLKVRIQK